jgi:hypothetical protein
MLFLILAVILLVLAGALAIGSISQLAEREKGAAAALAVSAVIAGVLGAWFQTHRIVPTQYAGIGKNSFTQKLSGPYPSGIAPKPFFGSMYQYPASSALERCEQYTPAIKGSYGITLDLCLYYDAGNVNWVKEVNRTGSLGADRIMAVWRNSIVGDVARSVKDFTPEALSDNRSEIEQAIFENISPWFKERGVPLTRVSFKNWDFTSEEVAKSFDASIVSQRKITEQTALFEAAKVSRKREEYEAETARLVAERQKDSLTLLGLQGDAAVQYLWIKALTESNKTPDVLILGTNAPIAIAP